jgi:hypothetical protein
VKHVHANHRCNNDILILMHGQLETQPIGRNAEREELDQAAFPVRGDPGFGPT